MNDNRPVPEINLTNVILANRLVAQFCELLSLAGKQNCQQQIKALLRDGMITKKRFLDGDVR